MPRVTWPLRRSRPAIRIVTPLAGGASVARFLLADTGAGHSQSGFELLLEEVVCRACGGIRSLPVVLSGAYAGTFPVYVIRVQIPELKFDRLVRVAGVLKNPPGFDGLAAFRFLNRFTYGNFGSSHHFGLES